MTIIPFNPASQGPRRSRPPKDKDENISPALGVDAFAKTGCLTAIIAALAALIATLCIGGCEKEALVKALHAKPDLVESRPRDLPDQH